MELFTPFYLTIPLSALTISYTGMILYFSFKLLSLRSCSKRGQKPSKATKLSVIIPFRNEENNINKNLESLKDQTLSKHLYEVIYVNDHSTDNSLIRFKDPSIPHNFKIIELKNNETGKKAAISKGIQNAKYDTIVTADCDCTYNSHWLEFISGHFAY
ncbi:MAG: glycosyltransferase family 2 protein, partial [Flavobacteriales bacterium]